MIGRRFAERVFSDERIAPRLKKSNIIIKFTYYEDSDRWGGEEPEVTVDTTQDPIKLYTGPCDLKPTVVMRMHADTAHRFWMQKLNLMVAITKGEIKVKGPIPQVMKLLPTIKPSFEIYKEVLKELGFNELLSYPP
jgi:putative sterol carrier protein